MGTTYKHVQLSNVKNNGDVEVLYPVNAGSDVSIDNTQNNVIPSNVKNVQDLVNNISSMAFESRENMVFINNSDASTYDGVVSDSEIDDTKISTVSTWSSKKLSDDIDNLSNTVNTDRPRICYLTEAGEDSIPTATSEIDDSKTSTTTSWSSSKIVSFLESSGDEYIALGNDLSQHAVDIINETPKNRRMISIVIKKNDTIPDDLPNLELPSSASTSPTYDDESNIFFIEYYPITINPSTQTVESAYQVFRRISDTYSQNLSVYSVARMFYNNTWSDIKSV